MDAALRRRTVNLPAWLWPHAQEAAAGADPGRTEGQHGDGLRPAPPGLRRELWPSWAAPALLDLLSRAQQAFNWPAGMPEQCVAVIAALGCLRSGVPAVGVLPSCRVCVRRGGGGKGGTMTMTRG